MKKKKRETVKMCPLRFTNGVPQPCLYEECQWSIVIGKNNSIDCVINWIGYLLAEKVYG